MKELLPVVAIAVFAAICGTLIKKSNREVALLFSLAAAVLICLYAITAADALIATVSDIVESSGMTDVFSVLLKALGIVIVGRIASSVCKDAGENTLATGVELAMKVAVLLVSLPLLQSLLNIIQETLTL